ncbi:hypothetical protein M0804_004605 [Polistes exclamans]|nr:hypothetical protein M0804_004605 [Polistes exclamans]
MRAHDTRQVVYSVHGYGGGGGGGGDDGGGAFNRNLITIRNHFNVPRDSRNSITVTPSFRKKNDKLKQDIVDKS